MKKILFSIITVFAGLPLMAQVINQDASGTSTIVAQGTSVSLNITETQIQASHYGLFNPKVLGNSHWFYGTDLKAKNSTGVATLFDEGKFSPDGSLSLVFGKRRTHFFYGNNAEPSSADLTKEESKLHSIVGPAYNAEVTRLTNAANLPPLVKSTLITDLKMLTTAGLYKIDESVANYKTAVVDANQVPVINQVVSDLRLWIAKQKKSIDRLQVLEYQLRQTPIKNSIPNSTTYWYIRGGFSASQFSYDLGSSFSDYSKRFMDTTAVTYQLALGYTYQLKRHFFGINLGYAHQSNKDLLTSADYKYSYQDTAVKSGKLSKDKSFTAYSGLYGFYGKIFLNIDYQYLFELDNTAKKYFGLGPYLRWNQLLKPGELAKNSTVLGVSANYIDAHAGKFLGGVYLQSSDITGHTQPQFKKSIQFGLVAKFSLSTIFVTD